MLLAGGLGRGSRGLADALGAYTRSLRDLLNL
jgi:hypothetical protein